VAAYLAAGLAVRAVNAIVIQAIVDHQINKERSGEDEN